MSWVLRTANFEVGGVTVQGDLSSTNSRH